MDFFAHLLDTADFPARWTCGRWTAGHGWLHVLSDIGVWTAYLAIPVVLLFFVRRKGDLPFRGIFALFGAFIFLCGTTHLMEALIFWWPAYRLAGVIKLLTAVVSWATVAALIPVVPRVLAMRSPEELEREVAARAAAEAALRVANAELEDRVARRTADLAAAVEEIRRERELFRTTLSSIGDGVIATDVAGRVTFVNPIAEALTGWADTAAAGRPLEAVFAIVNETTRAAVDNPALRALKEGTVVGLANHTVLIARDGSERPIDDSAAPIRDAAGAVAGSVLVFRDVTGRRAAERALEERERQFHTLAESIPQLCWMAHPDGHIFWYNRRWYEYTGTAPAAMEGWGWQAVHDPAELPKVMARWQNSVATGEPFDMVFPIRGADGSFRPFLTRVMPVPGDDGRVARWFGTNTDVSEAVRAADELREARSRLDSTLAAGEIGTWEFDLVRNAVYADPNLARMFGVTPAEAAGGPVEAYTRDIHPDDRDRVIETLGRAVEAGDRFETEYRLVGPGGAVRWVAARGRVERDGGGRAVRLPGVVADITTRKTAEERLRASEEQRRLALDSAELGAWHIDPAARTLATDERFQLIFAGRVGAIDYEGAFALIHPDDRDRVRAAVEASCRPDDPAPYAEEYRVVRAAGTAARWVFGKGRANFEGSGPGRRVASFDGTIADITDRKRLEYELRQLAANLSDADRRKNEFLATLAHELRNPLAPIRNGLQIIRLSGSAGTVEQARSMMDRQLTQLVRLVDDLLDVSRITRGKLELRRERIELRAVVESAVETARPIIEQAGHELAVTLPADPVVVDGDMTRLAQVVSNLLTNSAKYTHRGGHIRLRVTRDGGGAVVTVADDGIGIPPAMLGRVFEMFTQVDRALEKTTGGLGIGLSLVRGLVEAHGGTVEARSDGEGRGSEFAVRLPLAPAAAQDPPAPPPTGFAPTGRRRILVVDDNVDSADSLAHILELLGHEVRTAHDGEAGVAAAAAFRPAVALMDIGMPKLNGYEAARRIRGQPWGAGVVLVALTGWGQEDDRRRSTDAGFDFHLVKPVDTAALVKLLAGVPSRA